MKKKLLKNQLHKILNRHKTTTKNNTNPKIQKISTVPITTAFHCNNSNRISAFRTALHSNPRQNGW